MFTSLKSHHTDKTWCPTFCAMYCWSRKYVKLRTFYLKLPRYVKLDIAYRGRPPTTLSSITERNQIYFYKKKQRDFWQACLWLPVALETVKSLVPLQTKTSAHLVDKERTERIFKLTSSNLMAKKKLCCWHFDFPTDMLVRKWLQWTFFQRKRRLYSLLKTAKR